MFIIRSSIIPFCRAALGSELVLVSNKRVGAYGLLEGNQHSFVLKQRQSARTCSGKTHFRFTKVDLGLEKEEAAIKREVVPENTVSETVKDVESKSDDKDVDVDGLAPAPAPERIEKRGGRFYRVKAKDGSSIDMPSVTTVLGDIWKTHLKDWAVRTSLNQVETDLNSQVTNGNLDKVIHHEGLWKSWLEQLKERAVMVPNQIRDEAATLGTACHDIMDELIKGQRVIENGDLREIPTHIKPVTKAFLKWRSECNIDIDTAGDQFVWSKTFEYAGAMDAIGRDMNTGKLVAIDFKTSNSISQTYALQVAAYAKAYEELYGERVDRAIVVKFDKYKAKYEVHEVSDIDIAFNGFKSALYLYRLKNFRMMSRTAKKRVL